jgi:hypothetical protein
VYSDIPFEDEQARLDNFAIELDNVTILKRKDARKPHR